MASNGSFSTNSYGSGNYNRYLVFEWGIQSQNIGANTTTIWYTLKGAGGNTTSYQMSGNFRLDIDGQTVYETGQNDRIQLKNGTVLKTGTFTLWHDNAGNRSFGAAAWGAINTYARNVSGSGSWWLPNIPRNSSGWFSKQNYVIGEPITINFSRAGSSFTEDGWVQFPDIGGWVWQGQKFFAGAGDSWTWTPTSDEIDMLYAQIPNSQSAVMWADCKTFYNGSEIGQFSVGESSMSVDPAVCSPTFSVSYKDTNSTTVGITGNDQQIIRNQSTLQVNVTNISTKKSATRKLTTCTINGTTYTASSSTSTSVTFNIGALNVSSNVTATISVTDSRDLTTTQTLNISVLDWQLPSAIITMNRQNNFYTPTTINVDGSISSVDSKNTMTIKLRYKKTTVSTWSSYTTMQDNVSQVFQLDNNYAWNVQVVISDLFGNTTYNLVCDRGMPLAYFDRLKNSVGFNCFPQDEDSVESKGVPLNRNILTYSLNANITSLSVNTYTKAPMTTASVVGTRLTANNGDIVVGAGVSKLLVSAQVAFTATSSAGVRSIRVIKNNTVTTSGTMAWIRATIPAGANYLLTLPPVLINVSENDKISLYYSTPKSDDQINGTTTGVMTFLTADVVG